MTDRTHPDSGRIITSGDVIAELQDRIAELEAELEATKETSGGFHVWRDISTAPKDGSRFVAIGYNYGLYSEGRHICVAQWFRGCWMETSDWNEASELQHLTHWLPLPSPPDDVAAPAEQQAAPKAAQYEMDKEASNVRLDIDSNSTKPEQQRDVACSLEVGQHVGKGEHQEASCRGSKDSELLKIAARNLKYFIEHAQFSSFADKRAALNCLDVLASPQQEAQEPVGWTTSITWRPNTRLQSEQVIKITREAQPKYGYTTPIYTAPRPAPAPAPLSDDVVKDAARYRWLREGNDAKHGAAWHVAVNLYGCEWDAAIDAALAAQGGKG